MKRVKRFMATVLSLGMVLAGSMTSLAAELPVQQPEEHASVGRAARIIILPDYENSLRHVKGTNVNLRAEPGTSSRVVGSLDSGDFLYLSGEAEIKDGYTWLKVLDSPRGSGWIASNYVE